MMARRSPCAINLTQLKNQDPSKKEVPNGICERTFYIYIYIFLLLLLQLLLLLLFYLELNECKVEDLNL